MTLFWYMRSDADPCSAYAVYFDYQRRNNPDFRKALKRDAKRQARKAKEEDEALGKQQKAEIKAAIEEALEEGFPTDIEEKEAFFLQQISQGEAMANDGKFRIRCPILSSVN
jgi:import receptor subunit TOM20